MRAMVCHEFGPPDVLGVAELPTPAVGPGEVLVEVHAIGVNFTDVLCVAGKSQLKRKFPFTPGVEAAGVVMAVGEGVTKIRPGQRVLGTRPDGCYAEEVIFLEDEVCEIPDGMDMVTASTFYIVAMTAEYAICERAKLKAGENLLVLAAGGGVGLASIDIGKAIGAHVVAAASSRDKLDLALSRGADAAVLYPREVDGVEQQKALLAEFMKHAGSGVSQAPTIGEINTVHGAAGYHVVVDGVGGGYAEPAMRALAWQGRYLSVGFAAGVPKISLGPVLFKDADIMGIQPVDDHVRLPGRTPQKMKRLFDWFEQGYLRPQITATYRMEEAPSVLQMFLGRNINGRVVLTTRRHKT